MKKQVGNVGDIMVSGLCILGMTVVMLSYMDSIALIHQKIQVGQIARKYILRMETEGYLAESDRVNLSAELEVMGVTDTDLDGTTLIPTGYGSPIVLRIGGKLKGEYAFEEKRVSTAKN